MPELSCDTYNNANTSLLSLSPSLRDSIKNIIEKAHYVEYDVKIKDIDTLCDNFLGKLFEIDINGVTAKCKKEMNIFVKQIIVLKEFNLLEISEVYSKEVYMYNELSKIFKVLQDKANVPEEDRYKMAKSYDETNSDTIILENLLKRGFKTYKKKEIIPLRYAELAVQEMAKFHGLSFVIENKMPEYFNKKIVKLNCPLNFGKDWNELMRKICTFVGDLYDDDIKKRIEKFVPVLLEKMPKYSNDQTTTKCTLTHGDFKKNNVLVREKDGEPVEVVPVDYQLLDYGCPIRDLLFFIFSGTDQEFRRKHLNDLKELYFQTLSRFMKYFDMDVETVFPRKDFEKVYTEWLDYGLMMTLFASVGVFAPDHDYDFETRSLTELPYSPDKYYDDIIRGLVDDFIEWGYL